MGQIKDNLRGYKYAIAELFLIVRVMAFEKFTAVFFFLYLIFILSLAFIFSIVHWLVAVVIVLAGVLLFVKALNNFQFLKRALIRKDDRVEYADPNSSDTNTMFKTAKVLLKMKHDEMKKTNLISAELMEGNRHFYLVEEDKKPTVIAYDWIMGLSPEILE